MQTLRWLYVAVGLTSARRQCLTLRAPESRGTLRAIHSRKQLFSIFTLFYLVSAFLLSCFKNDVARSAKEAYARPRTRPRMELITVNASLLLAQSLTVAN